MKKYLSIIAAVGLTATASTSVVACGKSSNEEANKKYDNLLPNNANNDIIRFGDSSLKVKDLGIIKNNDTSKTLIEDWINNRSTIHYTNDVLSNSMIKNLNLANQNLSNQIVFNGQKNDKDPNSLNSINNFFNQEIKNISNNTSLENLFTSYTASLVSSKVPLDAVSENDYSRSGVDPLTFESTEFDTRDGNLETNSSIWFTTSDNKLKRWVSPVSLGTKAQTKSELFGFDLRKYLPTAAELSTSNFYIVKDAKLVNDESLENNDLNSDIDTLKPKILNATNPLTGRQALGYKFQNYINNNPQSTEKIMAMQYLKGDLYQMRSGTIQGNSIPSELEKESQKTLFLNKNSLLAKDTQTWFDNNQLPSYDSNYKMVWNFAVPKDKVSDINKLLGDWYSSKDDNNFLNLNNVNELKKDASKNIVSSLFDQLKTASGKDNQSDGGVDSLFNLSGFQGFVKKDGTSVKSVLSGSLNIDDSAKTKIANVNGPAILTSKQDSSSIKPKFDFANKSNVSNYSDFIVVLPIYLQDLFVSVKTNKNNNGDVSSESNVLNDVATDQWVELNSQHIGDSWTSASKVTSGDDFSIYANTDFKNPTILSYITLNNKTYVFVPKGQNVNGKKISLDGQSIIFNWPSKNMNNYLGINGIYSANKASSLNGQNVSYKLHLGTDLANSDTIETNWSRNFESQNVKDIQNLSNDKKQILLDNLLYLISDNDSQAIENAKNGIYKLYINPNDILYKPVYDDLIKYIKVNDKDETSN